MTKNFGEKNESETVSSRKIMSPFYRTGCVLELKCGYIYTLENQCLKMKR